VEDPRREGRDSVIRSLWRPRVGVFDGALRVAGLSLLVLVCSSSAVADTASLHGYPPEQIPTSSVERRLVQGLLDLHRGSLESALGALEELVRERPDFKLANLVYGDLLAAHGQPLDRFGQLAPASIAEDFQAEAKARLDRYLKAPTGDLVPGSIVQLPSSAPAALVVDVAAYRMYLVENRPGGARATRDYYVSIGKGGGNKRFEGDERTPIGVYHVNEYLPGKTLPDEYGVGAYPISYPNEWDRRLGRTGSGIWIHGTESANYSRAPKSSRGCVTLSNVDFESLESAVEIDATPVVVVDELNWVAPAELESDRLEIIDRLSIWERDWETLDTEAYLSHYATSFRTPSMDRTAFADHKRSVNRWKSFVRLEVEDVAIYRYPGEDGLVAVDFRQHYASDNFSSVTWKRQYWRRDLTTGQWQIVLETTRDRSA